MIPHERSRVEDRERERVVARETTPRTSLHAVVRLAAELNHRKPVMAMLESSLDALEDALQVQRTAVLLCDPGGEMRYRAWRGVSPEFRADVERFTPWTSSTGERARAVVADVESDPLLAPLRESARTERVRGFIFLPLYLEDRLFGRLDLYFDEAHQFVDDERPAAETIAHLLGVALARRREEAARRLLTRANEVLGASLELEETFHTLARLAIEELADGCVIHLLEGGDRLERVTVVDRDPAKAETIRQVEEQYPLRLDQEVGPALAVRTGEPQLYRDVPEEALSAFAADDQHLGIIRTLEVRTALCVPLITRGRTIGVITLLAHRQEHRFDDVDLEVFSELARRAALAVDNARLYRAEAEARRVAEKAAQRTERLRELSEALANARTHGQVAEVILQQALAALGATGGALGLRTAEGDAQRLVAAVGYPSEVVDRTRHFALDADLPLARAMRSGEPLFGTVPPADDGDTSSACTGDRESWVAIPIALDGSVIGALGLTFPPGRELDEDEWIYLQLLGRQSAQALERARLHDAELRSRTEAVEAQRRLLFLAEANALFASALDYETRLHRLARLAVESVADYCLLYLGDETGTTHHASAHIDPAREALVRRVAEAYRPSPENPYSLLARVVRTGRSLLVRELPPDFPDRVSHDPQTREAVARLGARSAIVVPLIARGQVIGAAAFMSARPDRQYDAADLAFAEELVRRAAVAVDNARLYRAALDANQSKANFLAVMSHELRTPLTAILGYSELLADDIFGAVTEQQREQLIRIRASGVHLLSLIEEILSFSRIEAGQELVRQEPTELGSLIEGTRVLIEPLVARKKLRYVVDVPSSPVVITTDAAKVRQILTNLLANAVKFTDEGTITLSARLEGDDAVFEVTDTGIGIPADHLQHIFEPFWQVEQSMTRRVGGTGLGLSVARQLAEMLGGDVSVRSQLGKGSTFTVRLPIGGQAAGGDRPQGGR